MTRIVLTLLASVLALVSFGAGAQDGPLRQRLKERREQREQAKTPPDTSRLGTPGDHRFTLQHGGLARSYLVHVPARLDAARPAPLLVALHGGGGHMEFQADDARYGLIGLSEREGVVVVFPNGYSKLASGKFATWNAGRCCGGARDANVDDVGFIRAVVAHVTQQLNVDRGRVYATGMSNGGLMAYRLACEASDVFRAIAPVAGTDNTQRCAPARPVSVLHIHARDDTHVLFDGGSGPGTPDKSKVTEFTSVPDTVAKWVRLNGCSTTPQRVLDKPGASCEAYTSCKDGAAVQLCVTDTGGHSWPGASKSRSAPASQAISAVDAMWAFFSRR